MSEEMFITVMRPRTKKVKWRVTTDGWETSFPATSASHAAQLLTEAGHPVTAARLYNMDAATRRSQEAITAGQPAPTRFFRPLGDGVDAQRVT